MQAGYCDTAPADHRHTVMSTVAEMLLLAESRALVIGRSRFSLAALLLSSSHVAALHVYLDPRCRSKRRLRRRRGARTERFVAADVHRTAPSVMLPPPASALPAVGPQPRDRRRGGRSPHPVALRCIGTNSAYSARWLGRDGMLSDTDGYLKNF